MPEIRFNYQGKIDHGVLDDDLGELLARGGDRLDLGGDADYRRPPRRVPLNVWGVTIGGRLYMSFDYSAALHDRSTIEALAAAFADQLRESIAHCRPAGAGR